MKKIKPQCHSFKQTVAMTATGHIVPCCWCDNGRKDLYDNLKTFGLYDEELKLSNVSSVKDILISKQWVNFHYIIATDYEKSPLVCQERCGENIDDEE